LIVFIIIVNDGQAAAGGDGRASTMVLWIDAGVAAPAVVEKQSRGGGWLMGL
jgi:hypothetical protein